MSNLRKMDRDCRLHYRIQMIPVIVVDVAQDLVGVVSHHLCFDYHSTVPTRSPQVYVFAHPLVTVQLVLGDRLVQGAVVVVQLLRKESHHG